MKKCISTKEAIELAEKEEFKWLGSLLSLFPNSFGINLCAVESLTFECEDDEYGQLTDLHVKFIPTHDEDEYKGIKANGGPFPWLKKNEQGEVVFA